MIKFLNRKRIYFINNKQGIVAPIFGMIALAVVTVTMSAVDIYQYAAAKSDLQALADKATLSGVALRDNVTTPTDRKNICESTFREGLANIKNTTSQSVGTVVNCVYDEPLKKITLTADMKIKTSSASGVGLDSFETTIISTASMNYIPQEIVVAISTSGTMCGKNRVASSADRKYFAIDKDEECTKIDMLNKGLDYLFSQLKGVDDLKIGLIPYTYKVKFPYSNDISKIPLSIKNSVLINGDGAPNTAITEESDFYTDFSQEPELGSIIGLQEVKDENTDTVKDMFKAEIKTDTTTPAWARTDLPLHVAGLMLAPDHNTYFNHQTGKDPLGWDTTKTSVQKTIILMTDGTNVGGVYTNSPTDNFQNQYLYQYNPYNKHSLDVCNVLKNKGVRIFTILLNVPEGAVGRENIENIMARCAISSTSSVTYPNDNTMVKCKDHTDCYDVKYITLLPDVFADIGRKLKQIKLRR